MQTRKKHSALVYVLKALIPYSRENMALSFAPNRFFNELEKVSGYQTRTLSNAYDRAIEKGYVTTTTASPRLTKLGLKTAGPFIAQKLGPNARLMIIFDIPESKASSRRQLRWLLKKWEFEQTQKSVWVSSYDHKESVKEAVEELELSGCVQLYECSLIFSEKSK